MPAILIEIGMGELIDKIVILEIKLARIEDEAKRANVRIELAALRSAADQAIAGSTQLDALATQLRSVNERLWELEDRVRQCEQRQDFGSEFVVAARSIYQTNDERAAIKRRINEAAGSHLVEEKSYGQR